MANHARQVLIVSGVLALLTGPVAASALASPQPASTQQPAVAPDRVDPRAQARPAEPDAADTGMPVAPVILFALLMVLGLGAVALLVKRLDIRGARRATAALSTDPVEEELQQMIVETVERRQSSAGHEPSTRPRR